MILNNFKVWSKTDLLVAVMVSEAETNTAEVILSNFQLWYKSDLLVAVMVPDAEMNMLRCFCATFSFGQKVIRLSQVLSQRPTLTC